MLAAGVRGWTSYKTTGCLRQAGGNTNDMNLKFIFRTAALK